VGSPGRIVELIERGKLKTQHVRGISAVRHWYG
jgi:superfamily II DNA/RNA helicase